MKTLFLMVVLTSTLLCASVNVNSFFDIYDGFDTSYEQLENDAILWTYSKGKWENPISRISSIPTNFRNFIEKNRLLRLAYNDLSQKLHSSDVNLVFRVCWKF